MITVEEARAVLAAHKAEQDRAAAWRLIGFLESQVFMLQRMVWKLEHEKRDNTRLY